jgi:hypothetical protein
MKHPRRLFAVLALLIALSVGVALVPEQTAQTATAAAPSPAVVVLIGFDTPLAIRDSQSSIGAPTFAPGDNLAQAVSDLLAAGFEIKHVDGLTYTLVKES